jgi:hypothetical protein
MLCPGSYLRRPILEARALTTLKLLGMDWKQVCPTCTTHLRSVACTTLQLTGHRRSRLQPSTTLSGSFGQIFVVRFFDRNSGFLFSASSDCCHRNSILVARREYNQVRHLLQGLDPTVAVQILAGKPSPTHIGPYVVSRMYRTSSQHLSVCPW